MYLIDSKSLENYFQGYIKNYTHICIKWNNRACWDKKWLQIATVDARLTSPDAKIEPFDPDCYLIIGHIRDYFLSRSSHEALKIRESYWLNMAHRCLRAPRGKEHESDPLEGSNKGLCMNYHHGAWLFANVYIFELLFDVKKLIARTRYKIILKISRLVNKDSLWLA